MSFAPLATRTDPAKETVTRRSVIGTTAPQARRAEAESPPAGDATAAGAKMSVVVISDLDALEKHVAAWEDLAGDAIEPNAFYDPWMLMPALQAYGAEKRSLFVLVQTPDPARPHGAPMLCGFFPLELGDNCEGVSARLPLKTLRLWRKPEMIYLCAPLLRKGYEREALAAFFDWLNAGVHGCSLMEFGFVTGEGPFHHLLVDYLHDHLKFSYTAESFTRAFFRPAADAEAYINAALSRVRRKEYRRQERRLAETGQLEYAALDPDAGLDALNTWIEEFLEFEAKSWKGKGGRALACSETDRDYFVKVAKEAFRRGKLMMLALRFNGRPIAYKVNFLSGIGSFAFKIAFDEEYARYSPGVLLELENIRALHERSQIGQPSPIKWMDSCADPDRFMINHLWTDRRAIQTMIVSTGKPRGDLALAITPLLKWANRQLFRRDLLDR
jgi:Acetyltransferase (GNAT) domain